MLIGFNLFVLKIPEIQSSDMNSGKNLNPVKKNLIAGDNQNAAQPDSYAESVHMYICIEGLKLLKMQFPQYDFSIFNTFIGTMNDAGTRAWQMGRITAGAYREDIEDVVFDIRGPFGFYASSSHFWNADDRINGDHSLTNLNIVTSEQFPNAYTKITKYIDGDWHSWNGSSYGSRRFIEYNHGNGSFFRYSYHVRGLIDLYRTNRIWQESYTNTLGQTTMIRKEVTIPAYLKNIIVWESLGRMAHLLQDMSVPSHTHNDVHVREWDGGDCYHNYIDDGAYNLFDAETARDAGGFFNPYENIADPIRYLIYTANQLADHYPSGPFCLDNPPQHYGDNNLPGGTYLMINNYYQRLGVSPAFIDDVNLEAQYCFNHAIRSTAALLYWFAIETGIFPNSLPSPPQISSFSKNLQDNYIYSGETLILTCNATGSSLNYNWFFKVCDTTNECGVNIPGLQITKSGNKLYVYNNGFRDKWTCSRYDSLCNPEQYLNSAPEALNLIFGVKVQNSLGEETKYFNFSNNYRFKPSERLRPPPPPDPITGCPILLIDTGGQFVYENNVLKSSQNAKNLNSDVEDKYIIKSVPYLDLSDNIFQFAVKEISNDLNYIDEVSLSSVDYPKNKILGVTETNELVLYSEKEVISPSYAELSGIDVTKELFFDPDNKNKVSGKKNSILHIQFDDLNSNSFRGNSGDNIAVIFDPSIPFRTPGPWELKDISGRINATDEDGNIKSEVLDFTVRQKNDLVINPVFFNKKIKSSDIEWLTNFELSYFTTVKIDYTGFNENKYNLLYADDLISGDVKNLLNTEDRIYVTLDSTSHLILKFGKISNNIPAGMERKYVFHIKGKSVKTNLAQERIPENENSSEEIFKSSLLDNYPNPFNPSTNIRYNLSSDNYTTVKIYNVQGKEVSVPVNEFQKSGFHTVSFNAGNLPSGIYYYTVSSGNFIATKKMILLK